MYSEIIVPLDGSARAEAALGPAALLARHEQAPLRLLSVVPSGEQIGAREAYLRQEAAAVAMPDAEVSVLVGDRPAAGITQTIQDSPGTFVCMATHGHTGLGRLAFGSVAEEVLRTTTAPVLLVGPHAWRNGADDFKTLIVAVDGSAVSESVLPAAFAWARAVRMRVILANVLPMDADIQLRGTDVQEGAYAAGVAAGLMAAARADGLEIDWDVLHGRDPARALVDYAMSYEGPVIALATHGRTGLSRLGGSVSMSVVRYARCPVLVVCPHCEERLGETREDRTRGRAEVALGDPT